VRREEKIESLCIFFLSHPSPASSPQSSTRRSRSLTPPEAYSPLRHREHRCRVLPPTQQPLDAAAARLRRPPPRLCTRDLLLPSPTPELRRSPPLLTLPSATRHCTSARRPLRLLPERRSSLVDSRRRLLCRSLPLVTA